MAAFQMWFAVQIGWLDRQERQALAYLIEENRVRAQLGGQRLRLTDDDRRRLAVRAFRLGRQALRQVATIVTPDALLVAPTTGSPQVDLRAEVTPAWRARRDPPLGRANG